MSDSKNYSFIGTELEKLAPTLSEEITTPLEQHPWSVTPCAPCFKEEWKMPFAVGKSCYLPYHLGSRSPVSQQHVYDVLEMPVTIDQERDYALYAEQLINILHEPHSKAWQGMKWNFDSSIKYMNLILYIPELFHQLASEETMIPKTAIPILGNTLHELISRTKAWVFTSGHSTPICNTVGEGVFKAALQEKSLVQGLKKRLEMTGVTCKYMEGEDFSDRGTYRYLLNERYCEAVTESLSPFSNLHIILRHNKDHGLFLEKFLFNLGLVLRLPTLKLVPRINELHQLVGFEIDFLDPYKTHTNSTSNFYDMLLVQSDLFRDVLSKADDFYYRNDDQYTEWNIMTMAIFLNDGDRVKRAVQKSQFVSLTDEAQIERIFRYALVYGSRKVVETVFENETLSKLLRQRAEKILELTFQKSSNEVFLYNRIMIALDVVDDMGNKKKKFDYLTLVKTAIQNLISHGLLWVPPIGMFRGEEVDHLLAFFPEYIMVWGVLSQRFEVIELFLKYSGLHLQYLSSEESSLSTHKGVYQICNALAISAMFRGVAKKLRRDISVTSADFKNLFKYSKRFDQIATEMLDFSLTKDEETLRSLLNTPSPFWSNRTALDIAYIGKAYTFLNHNAVQIYLHHVWSGYDAVRQAEGERVHARERVAQSILQPYKKSSLVLLYFIISTARLGYFLHGMFFLFLILCIIALLSLPGCDVSPQHIHPLEWVLLVCLAGFTIEEFKQYIRYILNNFFAVGLSEWRLVLKLATFEYVDSLWNQLDILIVLMFIISVVVRTLSVFIIDFPLNIPRLIYGLSALPIFIRSFQHILVIKAIGPLIYTMYQAFNKMLKFLIIILILSIATGTIQIALLSPTSASPSVRMRHLIFTPFFQIFGEYFFDDLQSHTYELGQSCSNISTGCNNTLDGIFWVRSDVLLFFTIAVWILIINVLILNLMIAYFTRIYDEVAANAESIYIWQFIEIVNEFSSRNVFPPPFNVLFYPTDLIKFLYKVNQKHTRAINNPLLQLVKEKGKTSNKFNIYFATHYENSFADKYWRSKEEYFPAAITV